MQKRASRLSVRAMFGEDLKDGIETGTRIKVIESVTVFHTPRWNQEPLDLQGREGTVLDVVKFYKGKELSATHPYKTQFEIEKDGNTTKLVAHLVGF